MYKSLFTEIRKLNLFGREMQFEKDFSNRFNSISSFILTILVLIALVIVSFLFGNEIYLRKNPKVSGSFKIVNVNETIIDLNEFPIIIGFLNPMGLGLNQSIVESLFTMVQSQTEILTNGTGIASQVDLDVCSSENYKDPEIKKLVENELKSAKVYGMFNYCVLKSLIIY